MKEYGVRLKVVEVEGGWQLMAVPDHGVGWDRIQVSSVRGTPTDALAEFASRFYELVSDEVFVRTGGQGGVTCRC